MSEEKKIPENCFQCKHGHNCNAAHYGHRLCKFYHEIEKRCVELAMKRERGANSNGS